jgi:tetratricopeptide (TPR) repeat protein
VTTSALGSDSPTRDTDGVWAFARSDAFLAGIANAYSEAVLSGADMTQATAALEAIRAPSAVRDDFRTRDAIDDRIGLSEGDRLERVLMSFRRWFTSESRETALAGLRRTFANDAALGWTSWLQACAKALGGPPDACAKLTAADLPFPAEYAQTVALARRGGRGAAEDRWDEAYELCALLAAEPAVDPADRVKLYVMAVEIQLFFFFDDKSAEQLLEDASKIASDAPSAQARLKSGWGELYLERKMIEQTRTACASAIEADENDIEAYLTMGDTYERENDLASAEDWYREGIKRRPGDAPAHMRFVRLYGRPDYDAPDKDAAIESRVRRAAAVSPELEHWTYVYAGAVYQESKRYDDAARWYDKAIAVDPTRMRGYIAAGYLAVDRENYDEARSMFEKAREVAPDAFDPYWALANLHGQFFKDDVKALELYATALALRPAWESFARARMGAALNRLGRRDEAERVLRLALAKDPQNSDAAGTLEQIAAACDATEALRIYGALRKFKGESYEAEYRNHVGNVQLRTGDVALAIAEYKDAAAANPSNAVYHANLAMAYASLTEHRAENAEKAIVALTRALELAPDEVDYMTRLGDLRFRLRLLPRFGEKVFDMTRQDAIVRILLKPDLMSYVTSDRTTLLPDLVKRTDALRGTLWSRWGTWLPTILFSELPDDMLPSGAYRMEIFDELVTEGGVQIGETIARFFPGRKADLERLHVASADAVDPATGAPGFWIAPEDWSRIEKAELPLWEVMEYPLRHFEAVCDAMLRADAPAAAPAT